jgi:hypothetical protein
MLSRKTTPPDDILAYDAARRAGNEPDLTFPEIWHSVRQRVVLIALLTVGGLTAGLALAVLLPARYAYISSVDIGVVNDGKNPVRYIESPNTVRAKLIETYIPLATAEFIKRHPEVTEVPAVDARKSSESDLIVIQSEGPLAQEGAHRELHEAVVGLLVNDHRQRSFRDVQPERQLSVLKGQAALLASQIERNDATRTFLENEAKQLEASIALALRNRGQSVTERADGANALAMLAATQEVQHLRDRLALVRERLLVGLPAERENLVKDLANNEREQQVQQAILEARENNTLPATRALSPPLRSLAPLGKSRTAIAGLGAGAGLVLGVLLAILAGLTEIRPSPASSRV